MTASLLLPCGHPSACHMDGACQWCEDLRRVRRLGYHEGRRESQDGADPPLDPVAARECLQFWCVEQEQLGGTAPVTVSLVQNLDVANPYRALLEWNGCVEVSETDAETGDMVQTISVCHFGPWFVDAMREIADFGRRTWWDWRES